MATTRHQRGFTLIELMVAVAIIGILSSVAIPNFSRATLRARKAERDVVFNAIVNSTQSYLARIGQFPTPFAGAWNPAGVPATSKRPFDHGAAVWSEIGVDIQGQLYHSYRFVTDTTDPPTKLIVFSQGDLDGNGDMADRIVTYQLQHGSLWMLTDVHDDDSVF